MLLERRFLAESFLANYTIEWPLSGMRAFMDGQGSFSYKSRVTNHAFIGLFAGVRHFVPFPVRYVVVPVVTVRTLVRLFSGVYSSVDAQMLRHLEARRTKLTCERFLLRVTRPNVFLHVTFATEISVAKCALKGSFRRVTYHVILQMKFTEESLITVLAGERSFSTMLGALMDR